MHLERNPRCSLHPYRSKRLSGFNVGVVGEGNNDRGGLEAIGSNADDAPVFQHAANAAGG